MKATRQAPLGASHTLAERLNTLMNDLQTVMRRYMRLCEAAPTWLKGDMYHGAARRRLEFSPNRVAYFTPDLAEAWKLAEMDSEVEGLTPRVFRVKLSVRNPARLDTALMQDLHMPEHRDLVARLRAEGYDCAIGEYGGEVCVFNPEHIHVQEIMNKQDTVQEASETGGAAQPSTVDQLVTWGEGIGVYATVFERPDSIELDRIDRAQEAPKGRGAEFIRALCAYADKHHKPLYGTVTGGNEQLEDYYRRFGFAPDEATRDDETDDVVVVRQPR